MRTSVRIERIARIESTTATQSVLISPSRVIVLVVMLWCSMANASNASNVSNVSNDSSGNVRSTTATAGVDASDGAGIHVAVASNFATTMRKLATIYRVETGFAIKVSSASTGKLYAQIIRGAPFDVFLAADGERPERLVEEGLADRESLHVYAIGRLVVVSSVGTREVSERGPDGEACDGFFFSERVKHLAIANPRTAPYGRAAMQTLKRLGAWERMRPRLVLGENISQTFQFVESGNAQAGFIARSQLNSYTGNNIEGCKWDVPPESHEPIVQKMVVLKRSSERPAVRAFEEFMAGRFAESIIEESGYAREASEAREG